MGLFQKKQNFSSAAPLYSLGMHKSVLVVGLGNPGKKYDGTRHNIGFAAIDTFANNQDFGSFVEKKDLKTLVAVGNVMDTRVVLMKPTTFMNLSGQAVQAVQHFYKIRPEDTLVVHDEIDIAFGKLRIGQGGGSAGHNGLKSLIEQIGADFWRIRIGVGRPPTKMDPADYVLQSFATEEQDIVKALLKETTAIIAEFTAGNGLPIETRTVF